MWISMVGHQPKLLVSPRVVTWYPIWLLLPSFADTGVDSMQAFAFLNRFASLMLPPRVLTIFALKTIGKFSRCNHRP